MCCECGKEQAQSTSCHLHCTLLRSSDARATASTSQHRISVEARNFKTNFLRARLVSSETGNLAHGARFGELRLRCPYILGTGIGNLGRIAGFIDTKDMRMLFRMQFLVRDALPDTTGRGRQFLQNCAVKPCGQYGRLSIVKNDKLILLVRTR